MGNEIYDGFKSLSDAQKRYRNKTDSTINQRRNMMNDDFDKEYTAIGDNSNRATIWLSSSPDLLYISRWEFKIIILPFVIPVASGSNALSPATLKVEPTSLETEQRRLDVKDSTVTPNPHDHPIQPNPHSHLITPNPHTHTVNAGITIIPVTNVSDMRIFIDDIDLTSHFKAQFPKWLDGEGMYPDSMLQHRYDILKACSILSDKQRSSILSQGYHRLEFESKALFRLNIREFKKYSFVNRQGDTK